MSGHDKHLRNEMKKLSRKLRAAADEAAGHEASSFEKHAQFLRDISGLCRRGLLRLAWNSVEKRVEQQTLESLKRHPHIQGFFKMAHESSVEQFEDLSSRLILQELHECDPHLLRPESQDSGGFAPRLGRKDLKGRSPRRSPRRSRSYEDVPVEEEPAAASRPDLRRPRSPSRSPVRKGVGKKPLPVPPPRRVYNLTGVGHGVRSQPT